MGIYDYKQWTLDEKLKTAKWFFTDCDRVMDALDPIELEFMSNLLESFNDDKLEQIEEMLIYKKYDCMLEKNKDDIRIVLLESILKDFRRIRNKS